MAYLHTIGLENFRLFKDRTVFELAPITILTGINNSGKSSLIKSLQLFQSSLHETKDLDKLSFLNGKHNLGWFSKAVNQNSEEKFMKFTFDFPIWGILDKTLLELTYSTDSKTGEDGYLTFARIFIQDGEELFTYGIKLFDENLVDFRPLFKINVPFLIDYASEKLQATDWKKGKKEGSLELISPEVDENVIFTSVFQHFYQNQNVWEGLSWDMESDVFLDFHKLSKKRQQEIKQLFEKYWKVGINAFKSIPDVEFGISQSLDDLNIWIFHELGVEKNFISIEEFDSDSKGFVASQLSDLGKAVFRNMFMKSILQGLKNFPKNFTSIEHLSSIRANTDRLYSNHSDIFGFNELLREFSKLKLGEKSGVKNFIDSSLKRFDIGDEIIINRTQGIASEVFIKKNGKKYLLADMGFGYTQLLPIIIKIALIVENSLNFFPGAEERPESIFLLEEPESNLHPSYQSKLAEMIVEAGEKFNIQFIIETHSEYFIRNLQYLTAIKKLKPRDTKIYYFHQPDSEDFKNSPFRKIEILPDGRLSQEFGEGFFDEIPRLLAFLYNSSFN